ncbi:DUF742 domain-containing protein [Actinomadura sp. 9N407]|uniref:DUF742 domain-containing protein n=1 Tax=Actinomadura sp. 9N407 TaxID=3375154 RepID=UPI0037BC19D4
MSRPRRGERALVRPHVVTGGRAHPTRNVFDLVTLVTAVSDRLTGLNPEERRIVTLCRGGALSVAEIAGHLRLPVGVVRVLLSDLMDSGHVTTRAAAPSSRLSRTEILQEVLDGLRATL